jgi:hypothetical protein
VDRRRVFSLFKRSSIPSKTSKTHVETLSAS